MYNEQNDGYHRHNEFGGPWTEEKLSILKSYLDAYTTVLKNTKFHLIYVDAFAGTGKIELPEDDEGKKEFIDGSAKIAVDIDNKPFDEHLFIEIDKDRCLQLKSLKESNPLKNIQIRNQDANNFLQSWRVLQSWRGVLFLDPFATEVDWATIEKIASFEILDTWILFPTSAISRMLPRDREPDSISSGLANSLDRIYGGDDWRGLYKDKPQMDLFGFGDEEQYRQEGVDGLIKIYKNKLAKLFGDRFLKESRTLRNPDKNVPLFEFMFCVGSTSPNGIAIAKRIAKHIIENL